MLGRHLLYLDVRFSKIISTNIYFNIYSELQRNPLLFNVELLYISENHAIFILRLSQLYPGVIIDAPPSPEVTLHHKTTAKPT